MTCGNIAAVSQKPLKNGIASFAGRPSARSSPPLWPFLVPGLLGAIYCAKFLDERTINWVNACLVEKTAQ
jgi:hypothetical protein